MKIGIVGQGFVGTAVREGLKDYHKIETLDLDKDKCTVDYLEDLVELTNITSLNNTKSCKLTVLLEVLNLS